MRDGRPEVSSWLLHSRKITAFLLNAGHVDNKGRDTFFRSFGFNPEHPEILARALIQQPRVAPTFAYQAGRVGEVRLAYDGQMETPDGRGAHVRTIWNYDEPPTARFITVMPHARPK